MASLEAWKHHRSMSPGSCVLHTTDGAQLSLLNGVSNPGTAGRLGDVGWVFGDFQTKSPSPRATIGHPWIRKKMSGCMA